MEIEVDDLTVGYQEVIKFINLTNDQNRPAPTFKAMATPDGASYIIIYQWSDAMTKTFNDREEAFYIDNVNEGNMEKAKNMFSDVYNALFEEYEKDPEQEFNMTELVNNIINKYSESKHK